VARAQTTRLKLLQHECAQSNWLMREKIENVTSTYTHIDVTSTHI
jgi:hypothetical protein